ncbi:PIH1 domain-containing protein 2 isoform X2 [Numida meleagris]|uniref:PIH1 domain-containing protein 2 isoform X2 n=1 Tax=Numida meleagris TaxID=8996 RepID=UPI000B3E1F02|nr:PIH1 domain-containing protein 2 isoform X2 [Numida meleagris]
MTFRSSTFPTGTRDILPPSARTSPERNRHRARSRLLAGSAFARRPPRSRPGPEEGRHFRSLLLRDGGAMADAGLGWAARLWALLDEMAENQPQAYRRLLREQRAQAEQFRAPPEPRLCVRALPAAGERHPGLGAPRGAACGPLFVNVCGWRRVPPPAEPRARIPVIAGPLEGAAGEGGSYSIIDIAYNPDVLQRREENPEAMEHLIRLTLKFIEERCNLILSHSYKIESFKLKGSPEGMWQRLTGRQLPAPHLAQNTDKELTLDQLLHSIEAEDHSDAPVLLKEESVTQSKVQLIEEITGTEVPEELSTPAYKMTAVKDANNKPDDVIIDVPEKYKLQLDLPELVDEEATTAVFNKGKGVLFITAPVAKPGQ